MKFRNLAARAIIVALLSAHACSGSVFAKVAIPDDEWSISVNKGELLLAQKDGTEAESLLIHAMAMSYVYGAMGAATVTQLLLGDFYFGRGDYKNAERFYQMASIEPDQADSVRGLKSLTALYLKLGKKEQAAQCLVLQKSIETKLAKVAAARKHVDYTSYFKKMSDRIKQYWSPPDEQKNKVVLVKFRLAPDGAISLLHIAHSSGIAEADEQALKAIAATAPLPAPSPAFSQPMDMQYTFDPSKKVSSIDPLKRNVPVKISRVDNVDVVDWPATEEALTDAIKKVQTSKKAKPLVVADLMMQLGDCYFEQNNSNDSIATYDKALTFVTDNKLGDKLELKCHQKMALALALAKKNLSADKQWRLGLVLVNKTDEKSELDKNSKIEFLTAYGKYLYTTSQTRDAEGIYKDLAELKKSQTKPKTSH